MPTEERGWRCDICLALHKKKHIADACEKSHKPMVSFANSRPYRCPGCGDPDCGGECEMSDMDFNN